MIVNNEVRTKHQTRERNELYFILNNIQRDFKDYDKKKNDKKNNKRIKKR